ncbi:MAG: HEAT repeat domain-containing protein [Blastocatellia bacterium]|nr:HEAT repeat domain-containing protein [Blastocatellia bacterium]
MLWWRLQKLKSRDKWARFDAAKRIGQLGDKGGVTPLISVLANDESKDVRKAAMHSLGLLGDARSVRPLLAVLKSKIRSCAMPPRRRSRSSDSLRSCR